MSDLGARAELQAQERRAALRVWLRELRRVARRLGRGPDEVWIPLAVVWLAVRLAQRRGLLPNPQTSLGPLQSDALARELPSLKGARLFKLPRVSPEVEAALSRKSLAACGRALEQLVALDDSADLLGQAYERMLVWAESGGSRRRSGSYYTPPEACALLVQRILEEMRAAGVAPQAVCDPACGGGAFLLACYRQLAAGDQAGGGASVEQRLRALGCCYGADVSPVALGVSELSLWLESGIAECPIDELPLSLALGDSLGTVAPGIQSIDWDGQFPGVFARGGFDLVLGNPPWVAFAGRAVKALSQTERRDYGARYRSWRGYPTLHGLFVELAVKLAPRGHVALLLPSPVADLAGYAAVREVATTRHRLITPLPELGEDAFGGVTQSSFGLLLAPAEQPSASHTPWPLEERSRRRVEAVELSVPEALAGLALLPCLPAECFGERGFQSGGGVSSALLRRAPEPTPEFCVPLLEGKDIVEFRQGPTKLYLHPDQNVLRAARVRLRPIASYQEVEFVVRQTARWPIAALHDGRPFRNSLLAGFSHGPYSASLLVGLLNSALYRAFHVAMNRDARQVTFPQVKIRHLRSLPAPPALPLLDAVQELARVAAQRVAAGGPLPEELRSALDHTVFALFGLTPEAAASTHEFLTAHGRPR